MSFVCEACNRELDDGLEAPVIPEAYAHLNFKHICRSCAARQRSCSGPCQKVFPATRKYFSTHSSSSRKYGLAHWCKSCAAKRVVAYKHRERAEKEA